MRKTTVLILIAAMLLLPACNDSLAAGTGGYSGELVSGRLYVYSDIAVSPYAYETVLVFSKTGGQVILESVAESIDAAYYSAAYSNASGFCVNGTEYSTKLTIYNEEGKTQLQSPVNFQPDYFTITALPLAAVGGEIAIEYTYKRVVSTYPTKTEPCTVTRLINMAGYKKELSAL